MLGALNTAVSGLEQFQNELNVIGNNIANSDTPGFKTGRIEFQDALSQTLQNNGVVASQVGTGVTTGAITNNFAKGTLTETGYSSDLAIDGDGFFVVSDPNTSAKYVTRAGNFMLDSAGYLITAQGLRVQGFNDTGLTTLGDIQIDSGGNAALSVLRWSVDANGKINETLSDNSPLVRGQILLQRFTSPQALVKEGGNLYSNIAGAGPLGGAAPVAAAPQTSGLGSIAGYHLESSNVDLAAEFANLIIAQRGFQANARMITTGDEVLQDLVSMKR